MGESYFECFHTWPWLYLESRAVNRVFCRAPSIEGNIIETYIRIIKTELVFCWLAARPERPKVGSV